MKTSILLLATILLVSCSSKSESSKTDSEKGKLEGSIYSNGYFGFKLKIDTPWHILNKEELSELMNDRVNDINETGGAAAPVTRAANILLSVTIDTVQTMPHFLISSLDLTLMTQIKNEKDYLEDYTRQVKQMYEGYDVQISNSDIAQETIRNKIFYTTLITIKADDFLAFQKRYATKIDNKLLNIMTNYNSDTYQQKCETLLNGIEWK